MNLFDLRLTRVKAISITGSEFDFGPEEGMIGFAVKFKSELMESIDSLDVGKSFNVRLSFSGSPTAETDPFLAITMEGTFSILGSTALAEIKGEDGIYKVASLIFPYLRNVAKPLIEGLGATAVEFPFHLPPANKSDVRAPKAKPRAKTTPKARSK